MECPLDVTLEDGDLDRALAHPLVRGLLEATSDGAVVIDASTRQIRAMNRRARQLLGADADEDMALHPCKSTLNAPTCLDACPLTAALVGEPVAGDLQVIYRGRGGDRILHARTRMIVLRGPDGVALAGVELFSDMTEQKSLQKAVAERRSLHRIIGRSNPMQTLYDLIEQVAPYDIPVLITGESGVGKERIADAVQHISDRAARPYIKVNCAAINPSLVESELFGHTRGAFTGANRDRRGSFEEAHTGTILLDEVGELPLGLQAKLLRVLQQGEIQRVGEDRPRLVDVRVIAATNRKIEDDVAAGHFREDLYYRLAGARLLVPPLRERITDVPDLAAHFLGRFAEDARERGRPKAVTGFSEDAQAWLMAQEWRGNVRELENVVRLAFIRVPDGRPIAAEHLAAGQPVQARKVVAPSLAELESQAIERALERTAGNLSAAARLLGIDRTTLWRKLKKGG